MATAVQTNTLATDVSPEGLPPGVFCRLTLDNEWDIKQNAHKWPKDKLSPAYSLSTEVVDRVFGLELSKEYPQIRIQIPGSKDSDSGVITDRVRFLDVVEDNKQKLKEVLEFTHNVYKANKSWVSAQSEFYKYCDENPCLSSREKLSEAKQKDPNFSGLLTKMKCAEERTWDADVQYRAMAGNHQMWSFHFLICMGNPYERKDDFC